MALRGSTSSDFFLKPRQGPGPAAEIPECLKTFITLVRPWRREHKDHRDRSRGEPKLAGVKGGRHPFLRPLLLRVCPSSSVALCVLRGEYSSRLLSCHSRNSQLLLRRFPAPSPPSPIASATGDPAFLQFPCRPYLGHLLSSGPLDGITRNMALSQHGADIDITH